MIGPLFLEQLLVMFVGLADTLVISYAGEAAVSGVSLVNQFNTIFIYLFTALAVYNAGAAVYRSLGKTNVTMYISVVSNVINVIGNVIGVFVFRAGVAGVAQSIWSLAALAGVAMGPVFITVIGQCMGTGNTEAAGHAGVFCTEKCHHSL